MHLSVAKVLKTDQDSMWSSKRKKICYILMTFCVLMQKRTLVETFSKVSLA